MDSNNKILSAEGAREFFSGKKALAIAPLFGGGAPDDAFIGFGVSDGSEAFYVQVEGIDGIGLKSFESIGEELFSVGCVAVFDAKRTIRQFARIFGWGRIKFFDVQTESWLCDTSKKDLDFQTAYKSFCDKSFSEMSNDSMLSDCKGAESIPPCVVAPILAEKAFLVFNLAKRVSEITRSLGVHDAIDQKAVVAIARLETNTVRIDKGSLAEAKRCNEEEIHRKLNDIFQKTGVRLDYESESSVRRLLKRTDAVREGESCDLSMKGLEELAKNGHVGEFAKGIVSDVVSVKRLSNFSRTTLTGMDRVTASGGECRFEYHNCVVPTGRLSSGRPSCNYFSDINIHSVAKPDCCDWYCRRARAEEVLRGKDVAGWVFLRDDDGDCIMVCEGKSDVRNVRRCFLPDEGSLWVTADMDSQELRIIANLYGERTWVDAFLAGKDIHYENAVRLFGKENYDSSKRKLAKEFIYGLNYGMSDHGFAERHPEMGKEECVSFISKFKSMIPNVVEGQKKDVLFALRTGYCRSGFSRKRKVSGCGLDRYAIERVAKNSPVQGIAGDVSKIQLCRIVSGLLDDKDFEGARFLLTIHDEINFSIPKTMISKGVGRILDCMETSINGWEVPLTCSVEIGKNWGETFKFTYDKSTGELVPQAKRLI